MCHGGDSLEMGTPGPSSAEQDGWVARQCRLYWQLVPHCCSEGVGEATGASSLNLAREQRHSWVIDELN